MNADFISCSWFQRKQHVFKENNKCCIYSIFMLLSKMSCIAFKVLLICIMECLSSSHGNKESSEGLYLSAQVDVTARDVLITLQILVSFTLNTHQTKLCRFLSHTHTRLGRLNGLSISSLSRITASEDFTCLQL